MNAAPAAPSAAPPRAEPSRGLLVSLGSAALLLHVATNRGYGVFRDEFYYLACGRHLAWGYVDHPPLIALLARLTEIVLGNSPAALRFLPAIASAATVVLAGLLAAELGGGRFAQGLAATGVLVAPVYLATFTIFTMNAFEIVAWSAALLLVARLLRSPSPRLWIALGVLAGAGLLNKHSVLFLLFGLAVGVVATPARRILATPWPWMAALVAAALFAPHLVWQARHGWPTLEFMENARLHKNFPVTPAGFLWGQVLLLNPLTCPVWIAGVGYLLVARAARPWRALGWAYLAIFVLFVVTQAKIYYLAPFYPALLAAGSVAFESATAAAGRLRALTRPALVAAWVVTGVILAPAVLPVLPPERLAAYMQAIHLSEPPTERHRTPPLPQMYADMFGWPEMVGKIAEAWNALSPDDRRRCVIYASNYGEAGAIDYYGKALGLPAAVSGHNSYWLWGPGTTDTAVAITIGEDRADVEQTYTEVTEVGRTSSPWAMPYENDVPIYVGRGPRASLREVWPRCKKYI